MDQGLVLQDDVDDPLRTALRQVVGVFSELERRMVVKRLKDGRETKRLVGGKSTGSYAYGFEGVGKGRARNAGPVPHEHEAIQTIVQSRADGLSYRAIASQLDLMGVKPRRAATWSAMTVRAIHLRARQAVPQKTAENDQSRAARA